MYVHLMNKSIDFLPATFRKLVVKMYYIEIFQAKNDVKTVLLPDNLWDGRWTNAIYPILLFRKIPCWPGSVHDDISIYESTSKCNHDNHLFHGPAWL